ncbi:MAG: cadmium-translocating P-type ATPase [Myxococcales bacterium]|nr:cadmium-translocating P-type ATPase [Myxococcales bacterium]
MNPLVAHCPHCGLAVAGAVDAYCCSGCELAAAIVSGAGLQRYYATREAPAPRPEPLDADWRSVPVRDAGEGEQACRLAIDGLRCASCVWLVEGILGRTEGVSSAHVSYATGRATVVFDPRVIDLAAVGARIAALGYRPRPVDAVRAADRDLLVRLGVAAFCAANVMTLSASVYAGWFDGMAERYAALFRWMQLVLATPVALWSAGPFFEAAWRGLRHRVLAMDLPISLAVAAMYAHGVWATLAGQDAYLDSLTMLVTLLVAGRVLEARGRSRAAAAAAALAASWPTTARRCTADGVQTVSVDALAVGDRVEVGLGEEVPADGVVTAGTARVRMALLTGESEPVAVRAGDRVVAGAPVVEGAVTVLADRVGADTLGRRMASDLLASVDRGLPTTPADRIAPWFTAGTLVAAGVGLAAWTVVAGVATGLHVAVAVLVVACPCALGLSWPVAVSAGLAAVARRGLVLRSGTALLRLADVDVVALDKTGTVTAGEPRVLRADDAVLALAAGLERSSHHPIARALRREAAARGLPLPLAIDVREQPGRGIVGSVDGCRIELRAGAPGCVVLLRHDDVQTTVMGEIALADTGRADAPEAVARLQQQATVALLTGDKVAVAQRIGAQVGIAEVHGEMTPQQKAAWVRARQEAGHRVLFVGDGLNDGPALVASHVGLAMGSGVAATVQAADGVVTSDALGPVVAGVCGAQVVRRVVRANLARSVAYNVVAVAVALAGWVDPLVAAVLMPLSSAMVLVGGLRVEPRLRRMEATWTSS